MTWLIAFADTPNPLVVIKLASHWADFVLRNSERGRGKPPKWALQVNEAKQHDTQSNLIAYSHSRPFILHTVGLWAGIGVFSFCHFLEHDRGSEYRRNAKLSVQSWGLHLSHLWWQDSSRSSKLHRVLVRVALHFFFSQYFLRHHHCPEILQAILHWWTRHLSIMTHRACCQNWPSARLKLFCNRYELFVVLILDQQLAAYILSIASGGICIIFCSSCHKTKAGRTCSGCWAVSRRDWDRFGRFNHQFPLATRRTPHWVRKFGIRLFAAWHCVPLTRLQIILTL